MSRPLPGCARWGSRSSRMRARRETERSRPSALRSTSAAAAASTPASWRGGGGRPWASTTCRPRSRRRRSAGAWTGSATSSATRRDCRRPAVRRLRSWTLQEPQIERRKYQDNSDVHDQPIPEVVPEEQDVHADHDGYHPKHVKHDSCPASHRLILVCTTLARLTCRRPLIRAPCSAATEGWHPRQIGGYSCALREQCRREATPQGPRGPGSAVYICTASGRRERPHMPR